MSLEVSVMTPDIGGPHGRVGVGIPYDEVPYRGTVIVSKRGHSSHLIGHEATVVGVGKFPAGYSSVGIGSSDLVVGDVSVAIGNAITNTATHAVGMGFGICGCGRDSVAIGRCIDVTENSISLGATAPCGGIAFGFGAHGSVAIDGYRWMCAMACIHGYYV